MAMVRAVEEAYGSVENVIFGRDPELLTYAPYLWVFFASPSSLTEIGKGTTLEVSLPPVLPPSPGGIPLSSLSGLLRPSPDISFVRSETTDSSPDSSPESSLDSSFESPSEPPLPDKPDNAVLRITRHTGLPGGFITPKAQAKSNRQMSRLKTLDMFRSLEGWQGFGPTHTTTVVSDQTAETTIDASTATVTEAPSGHVDVVKAAREALHKIRQASKKEAERLGWDTALPVRQVPAEPAPPEAAEPAAAPMEPTKEEKPKKEKVKKPSVDASHLGAFLPPQERLSHRSKKALATRLAKLQEDRSVLAVQEQKAKEEKEEEEEKEREEGRRKVQERREMLLEKIRIAKEKIEAKEGRREEASLSA
ncbi:hypothetical protein DACRYDRAFT_25544 [Dacryopinax primogenitus]|uniref:Uncharacterized protein n=1 Tax=Dacryopinax primogenitus (strain DJM 731) TaxID=1858805 RepID=M5FP19_DACPD|nr:uncharacterized protein DACRYDRAFT_25544 [Dacryopinax primogenitus]EJT96723.1 hypothetical protein DACRYDRAFT_25544 [Dacryopinax primogenitus]